MHLQIEDVLSVAQFILMEGYDLVCCFIHDRKLLAVLENGIKLSSRAVIYKGISLELEIEIMKLPHGIFKCVSLTGLVYNSHVLHDVGLQHTRMNVQQTSFMCR